MRISIAALFALALINGAAAQTNPFPLAAPAGQDSGARQVAPAGALKALPYFQVPASNGPWFTAPGSPVSRARLSTPAGAASGNWFC